MSTECDSWQYRPGFFPQGAYSLLEEVAGTTIPGIQSREKWSPNKGTDEALKKLRTEKNDSTIKKHKHTTVYKTDN